jgi:FtsZ-binding cell division protein ZapB
MEHQDETDQFKVLEDKVGALISKLSTLKEERDSLMAKVREQDKTISDIKGEFESLKSLRDNTKSRIQAILDKISNMDL